MSLRRLKQTKVLWSVATPGKSLCARLPTQHLLSQIVVLLNRTVPTNSAGLDRITKLRRSMPDCAGPGQTGTKATNEAPGPMTSSAS